MPSISYLIFSVTVVFLVVFSLKMSAAKKKSKASEDFWERERKANMARRVDPDTIEYLRIPVDTLPFQENPDEELQEIQDTIKALSQKRLLNLTGLTNTDIKLTYGTANLPLVSQCDQRFTQLARTLYKWASYLLEHGETKKAQTVLEYAVSCQTDISGIYTMLADIYLREYRTEDVAGLILTVEKLPTLMKDSIIQKLKAKLADQ